MTRCTHTYDGDACMKVNGSMLECVDGYKRGAWRHAVEALVLLEWELRTKERTKERKKDRT